jgi:hypothetical protein
MNKEKRWNRGTKNIRMVDGGVWGGGCGEEVERGEERVGKIEMKEMSAAM